METPLTQEKQNVLESLHDLIPVPFTLLDQQGNILYTTLTNPSIHPLFQSVDHYIDSLNNSVSSIQIIETEFFEKVLAIPCNENQCSLGQIFIGPIVNPQPKKQQIESMLHAQKKRYKQDVLENYYLSLKFMHDHQLIHLGNLTYYLLFAKTLPNGHSTPKTSNDHVMKNNDMFISQHEPNVYHHDPLLERKVYQYIEDGDINHVIHYWKEFSKRTDFEYAILSKSDHLRSEKNLTIAMITLATRAAINGGVHPEKAYSLGDRLIQELESLSNASQIHSFKEHVLYQFTEKVAHSQRQQYSKKISECQKFIVKHLFDGISISMVAQHVGVNPKYLSNIFKHEVGITLSEYIQKRKIDEAKKFIIYTDDSLIQIASMLHFTDQSYFTKIFKKHTNLTPAQFRNAHKKYSYS
ncbi:AraC family transcriptional regulator [Gracilibacillus halophilus YIM-C55.5]|uniref:AraC family transcriptional regulator n=2 Tax=Gracilibacillus TaxID=74385 RepID=N4W8K8_9BACI|nr:AraC family transcriptional regulator [Gracilibacillus halophilus YIM-C55.5]